MFDGGSLLLGFGGHFISRTSGTLLFEIFGFLDGLNIGGDTRRQIF
jgi:hypothetical protein